MSVIISGVLVKEDVEIKIDLLETITDFNTGNEICQTLFGGTLPRVDDLTEFFFIEDLMNEADFIGFDDNDFKIWIGLEREANLDGTFNDLDTLAFFPIDGTANQDFFAEAEQLPWAITRPQADGGCVQLTRDANAATFNLWDDTDCANLRRIMCRTDTLLEVNNLFAGFLAGAGLNFLLIVCCIFAYANRSNRLASLLMSRSKLIRRPMGSQATSNYTVNTPSEFNTHIGGASMV